MFGRRCCCNRPMGFGFGNQNNTVMECEIIEPTINKCVEQECYHEVPQV